MDETAAVRGGRRAQRGRGDLLSRIFDPRALDDLLALRGAVARVAAGAVGGTQGAVELVWLALVCDR